MRNSRKLIKNIKINDIVSIISGKDKGKTGAIKSIDRKRMRVIVENVALCVKHQKRQSSASQSYGILEKEAWLPLSKIKKNSN